MDGSFGLIFNPDRTQVLLVKRRDVPIWELPGGCIEKDESPEMAVVREVFEETGYRVDPVRKIGQYYYPKKLKTNHYYECMIVDGEKRLSNESKAVDYFNINALPEMLLPETALCIEDVLIGSDKVVSREISGCPRSFLFKGILHPWVLFKYLLTTMGIHWNT